MAVEKLQVTREDLKALGRELLQEVLWEWEQQLPDPDEGLELRPELAEYLENALREKRRGIPLEEVKRELGIDEYDE